MDKIELKKAYDYIKGLTASIVYTCPHDYSAGIEGAVVDYIPETFEEFLQELGIEESNTAFPVKTLQECKDEVSKKEFRVCFRIAQSTLGGISLDKYADEAAEMYADQFKNKTVKVISDEKIEKAGYADCGDKSNHRFITTEEIEAWIEGAKWYKQQLTK